jgi:hypothetical protein
MNAGTEPMDKLRELVAKWRAYGERGTFPTEREIGYNDCADELEAALRQQTPAQFETIDGEQQTHAMVVRNLSMLVRRLIHRIHSKYKAPDDTVAKQAWDYLIGEGLQGSVLRGQPDTPPTPREGLDDPKCPYCGYPRSQHSPVEAICPVQPQTALEGGRAAGQTSGDAVREADAQLLFIYEQVLKEMRTHAKGVPKGIIAEWVDRLDWHRDEHAKRKRAALGQTSTAQK